MKNLKSSKRLPDNYKSGTILIPSGTQTAPDKKHLFIICTEPCKKGDVLIVPIATYKNKLCDETCILENHEHEFITRKSYVLYRKSRQLATSAIDLGIQEGDFIIKPPMNAQSMLKIVNGICRSAHTPRKIKIYFGCS